MAKATRERTRSTKPRNRQSLSPCPVLPLLAALRAAEAEWVQHDIHDATPEQEAAGRAASDRAEALREAMSHARAASTGGALAQLDAALTEIDCFVAGEIRDQAERTRAGERVERLVISALAALAPLAPDALLNDTRATAIEGFWQRLHDVNTPAAA